MSGRVDDCAAVDAGRAKAQAVVAVGRVHEARVLADVVLAGGGIVIVAVGVAVRIIVVHSNNRAAVPSMDAVVRVCHNVIANE